MWERGHVPYTLEVSAFPRAQWEPAPTFQDRALTPCLPFQRDTGQLARAESCSQGQLSPCLLSCCTITVSVLYPGPETTPLRGGQARGGSQGRWQGVQHLSLRRQRGQVGLAVSDVPEGSSPGSGPTRRRTVPPTKAVPFWVSSTLGQALTAAGLQPCGPRLLATCQWKDPVTTIVFSAKPSSTFCLSGSALFV